MLQNWKTIEPVRKKKLPFVNFQSHFLTTSPLWIKYTNTNKKNNWTYLPSMKSLSGSDLLKYARLPYFLAFFNLFICIFLSSFNSFGISSSILKFVSLSLRPQLNTRSLFEYLKKRAIIIRPPFPVPLLGFPILRKHWNSMPFASSKPRASSIKLTRTFFVSSAEALCLPCVQNLLRSS